jgi:hypothetical protein
LKIYSFSFSNKFKAVLILMLKQTPKSIGEEIDKLTEDSKVTSLDQAKINSLLTSFNNSKLYSKGSSVLLS